MERLRSFHGVGFSRVSSAAAPRPGNRPFERDTKILVFRRLLSRTNRFALPRAHAQSAFLEPT
jgi:hypothetical protein